MQNSFDNVDIKEGLMRYRVNVRELEIIAISAKRIDPDDYEKKLTEYSESKEYMELKDNKQKQDHAYCERKLELLLDQIFAHRVATNPLKV